jgi:predicted lipoprotein
MKNHYPFHLWRPFIRLALLLLAGAFAFASPATAASVSKDALLSDMVRKVIRPDYEVLAAKSQALTAAIEQLTNAPTPDSLAQARAAWLATVLAARQIQWLQTGPIADREYLATFYYSKVLPHRIEDVLNSSGPLDAAYLNELGAATKGLFALEYVLFESRPESRAKDAPPPEANPKNLPDTQVLRRCQFLLALANDVQKKTDQVAADWAGTNQADVGRKFVAGGQETLNSLVNQLAQNLETIAESRINLALQLPAPVMRQLNRIEGARSRTSLTQLVASLRGTYQIYRGSEGLGLDDYLRALNPALETRIEQQFQKAITALQAVESPIEEAVGDRKEFVQRAYEAIRDLEILFKVDLASALGVTIMFNSNDGD